MKTDKLLNLAKTIDDIRSDSYKFQAKNPDLINPYKTHVDQLQIALNIISDRLKDIAKED